MIQFFLINIGHCPCDGRLLHQDISIGKKKILSTGKVCPELEGIGLAHPARWQVFNMHNLKIGVMLL